MLQFGLDVNEHRMAPTDDERNVGLEPGKVGLWRVALNPWRIKVSFVVMYSNKRTSQRKSQSLSGLEPRHQCAGQPRSLCGSNCGYTVG